MSATSTDTVSVVIPVYNAAAFLAEALRSVAQQTHAAHEIIVVDDGSTDDSMAVAATFAGVRCFHHDHSGIGATRNAGVAHARGTWLAFLDADDRWTPDKLHKQLSAAQSHPDVDVLFGGVWQFHDESLDQQPEEMPISHAPIAGTMLLRTEAFHRVGPFSDLRVGEFLDWHSRATALGLKMHHLPDVLLHRRIHANNTVKRRRDERSQYLAAMKAHLDRRRRAG